MVVYHDLLNHYRQTHARASNARNHSNGAHRMNRKSLVTGISLQCERRRRTYLTDVWGISPNRIAMQTRGLPEKPSSLTEQDGKEENRRVEISATDPCHSRQLLLFPTHYSRPIRREWNSSQRSIPQSGVKKWELYVTQPLMTLHRQVGTGTPAEWDWNLRGVAAKIPRTEDTIEYGLTITDNAGQERTAIRTIPVTTDDSSQEASRT